MVEFKLPDVGEGMHEGEITRLLVREGERVGQDQPIIEVQTDKVNAELSSPVEGVIHKIFYSEGDTVEVGSPLFLIATKGIQDHTETVADAQVKQEETAVPLTTGREPKGNGAAVQRVIATPYVRQLAREMKINIEEVDGTGPAGRVREQDLHRFTQQGQRTFLSQSVGEKGQVLQPVTAPIESATVPVERKKPAAVERGEYEERVQLKGVRKKIAEHMVKSVSIIPHVTHVDELEMDGVKALRDRLKTIAEERHIKLTYLPFFIKAIIIALKEFKTLNASIDDQTGEIVLKHYYHIGIATDTKEGLIVPVIKHADRKSILQLAEEIEQLAALAREGKLTFDQITGGTFTISNVGQVGGLQATPIINHPEVAILALHKMEPRMVVRNWEGVIRLMINMSLSFDHRLIDGVTAVKFTNRIKQLLENPDLLFAEMV